jgi:hypothetical protein
MSKQPAHVAESGNPRVDDLVVQFLEEKRAAAPKPSEVSPLTARRRLAAILSLMCATAWLAPYPAPPAPAAMAPKLIEASARMNVFLAAQRVRVYDSTHRGLPATLADAGVSDTTLEYVRRGTRFTITSSIASMVAYDSAVPADIRLAGAETVIDGVSR